MANNRGDTRFPNVQLRSRSLRVTIHSTINGDGVTHVVKPGAEFQLIAKNELGEKCFASPAISEGRFFSRGDRHLFCIGQQR